MLCSDCSDVFLITRDGFYHHDTTQWLLITIWWVDMEITRQQT